MGELHDADPVSELLAHFKADPVVLEALGGETHISGLTEGPWPHLVVSPGGGGDLRDLLSSIEPDVLLEVVGPLDGTMGPAGLWRIAMKVLVCAKSLPDRDHVPGHPVVSFVRLVGGLNKQPLASGQTRWQATVHLTMGLPQD